jgi:hypothetical protein
MSDPGGFEGGVLGGATGVDGGPGGAVPGLPCASSMAAAPMRAIVSAHTNRRCFISLLQWIACAAVFVPSQGKSRASFVSVEGHAEVFKNRPMIHRKLRLSVTRWRTWPGATAGGPPSLAELRRDKFFAGIPGETFGCGGGI